MSGERCGSRYRSSGRDWDCPLEANHRGVCEKPDVPWNTRQEREAHDLRAEVARLTAERDRLRALVREAAEVVRGVEWSDWVFRQKLCPACSRFQPLGHMPDCRLAAVLRRLEGVGGEEHE